MVNRTKRLKCAAKWKLSPGSNVGYCLYITKGNRCTLLGITCPYDGRHEVKYHSRFYDEMMLEKARKGGKVYAELRSVMEEES